MTQIVTARMLYSVRKKCIIKRFISRHLNKQVKTRNHIPRVHFPNFILYV